MAELLVSYPDELAAASGKPRPVMEQELRVLFFVKLFEVGWLTLGQAAAQAGMNKLRFMDELARFKVPVINLDEEETEAELRAIRGTDHR